MKEKTYITVTNLQRVSNAVEILREVLEMYFPMPEDQELFRQSYKNLQQLLQNLRSHIKIKEND